MDTHVYKNCGIVVKRTYALDFNGRVQLPSVKNFKIACESESKFYYCLITIFTIGEIHSPNDMLALWTSANSEAHSTVEMYNVPAAEYP